MTQIAVNPSEYGIEETRAAEITVGLKPILEQRNLLIERFNEVKELPITPENIEKFRRLRIDFRDNRTKGINKWHEKAKEVPLRLGQLIDAIKKAENQTNETHEEFLEKAEKHFENLEKERIAKLKADREAELSQYCEFVSSFPLGEMTEEAYQQLLGSQKLAHEAKIEAERKAAEAKAEQERKERVLRERHLELAKYAQFIDLAELNLETTQEDYERLLNIALGNKAEYEAKQAEIAAENERLRKEAEEKEKQLAVERAKAEAEKKAAEEKARLEREESERKLKAEREAAAEKLRKEQEAARKLAEELEAKKQAEAKAEADRLAAEAKAKADAEKLAKAPIKKQLNVWVNSFELPQPTVENATQKAIAEKFEAFKKWALSEVEKL